MLPPSVYTLKYQKYPSTYLIDNNKKKQAYSNHKQYNTHIYEHDNIELPVTRM